MHLDHHVRCTNYIISDARVDQMNLRNLRTFIAIADAGGIHRAAGQVNLSQSAASRQIQALEFELGCPCSIASGDASN
jgi:hypothetical protein